jgi:hypothetical protein
VRIAVLRQKTVNMLLRVPVDVKTWLEQQASRTLSSQNSEVIRSIRARMESEQRERAAG